MQRTNEHSTVFQYIQLLIPTIIGTALWGTCDSDLNDPSLLHPRGVAFSKTFIASLSEVAQAFSREDVLGFCEILLHS